MPSKKFLNKEKSILKSSKSEIESQEKRIEWIDGENRNVVLEFRKLLLKTP